MRVRVIFALPKVRAKIPEGRRDGPAQIFTDLVPTSDSGRRPSEFARDREVRNSGGSMSDGP